MKFLRVGSWGGKEEDTEVHTLLEKHKVYYQNILGTSKPSLISESVITSRVF